MGLLTTPLEATGDIGITPSVDLASSSPTFRGTFVSSLPRAPVRWTKVKERGIVGLAPAPEPDWFANCLPTEGMVNNGTVVFSGRSAATRSSDLSQYGTVVQTSDLKKAQVSRLIRIARDWSKQAEEASAHRTVYAVEDGIPILNPSPPVSFEVAYTNNLLTGTHRLIPQGKGAERLWVTLWRLRAARDFLRGASADAIVAGLRGRLAELMAGLAAVTASRPRTLGSQILRLAHFVVPNAPPACLLAGVL
jgi:hypothetical protein